jgi:hypothetical protein
MDFFYEEYDKCLAETIDSLKILLYKRHIDIFERLDFENDEIYQEPLLFAYITQNETKWLDAIIYGYEKKVKDKILVFTNKNGTIYIPKIGYFKTNIPNSSFFLSKNMNDYVLTDNNGKKINFIYDSICYLDEGIELVKTQHPLLQCFFSNLENRNVDVDIENVYSKHISHFNNALDVIKKYYNDYFQLIKKNIKKVIIYEGTSYSFAAIQAHNMIFLSVNDENDEIFFLDHILHEGAHVIFNTLTFNTKNNLFTVPFNSKFASFTKNKIDHGEVYGGFHGMFTQSNINPCMEICIRQNVFTGKQHYELLGRFSSNIKRFGGGIQAFDLPDLYKNEGLEWYVFFKNRFNKLYLENRELVNSFDVSNQPYVFSYEIFKNTNKKLEDGYECK